MRTFKKNKYFLNKFIIKLQNYEKVNYLFYYITRAYGYSLDFSGLLFAASGIFISVAYIKDVNLLGIIIVYICLWL